MIEYKQPAIVQELRRRIVDGVYTNMLPTTAELADEFNVNIKTMHKAIGQLVTARMLERRKRCGTRVISDGRNNAQDHLIEVIFEGFTTIFTHPFWRDIWAAMLPKMMNAGYRPVLNMLETDPETSLLKMEHLSLSPAAGRIVLGISERRLFEQLQQEKTPFISAGDPIDGEDIPQVSFDFSDGIRDAIDFLAAQNCQKIAFIGQTQSYVNVRLIQKFNAYLKAIQRYRQLDPALVENVRPLVGVGAAAVRKLLDRVRPDAILAAYDHQLPEILAELKARKLNIPVIGCDGLMLSDLPLDRHVVIAPRRECGEQVVERLINAIKKPGSIPVSLSMPAYFV